MKYENTQEYIFEDFINDPSFRAWVFTPNDEVIAFWEGYKIEFPQKMDEINKSVLFLTEIREYYDAYKPSDFVVDKKFNEFIARHPNHNIDFKPSGGRKKRFYKYAVAASIAMLMVTVVFLNRSKTVYSTAYGEYKKIELADGSVVTLGANSELELHEDWNSENDRKVWLKGEAYFKVKPNEVTSAKFVVITDDLNVEVLGTEFNVSNRLENTKVILDKGKIKLNFKDDLNEELFLSPGEKITYTSKSRKVPVKLKAEKNETSWKSGVITFDDSPLVEVLTKMEDIYGVRLKLNEKDNSLLNKKITIGIAINDKEVAIKTIEMVLGIKLLE